MTRAVQRETLSAGNLANIDTPGYRAREVSFESALGSTGLSVATTDAKHLSSISKPLTGTVKENQDMSAQRNGNNVQLDRELLEINRAMGDFNSAQTVLAAKFRLVRYAINDGK
jgi:flagellar basal-body rod protein FlgB